MTGTAFQRAGRLACLCPDDIAPDDLVASPAATTTRAAAAFALSILAQVLVISVLPLAGAMLAPEPLRAGWPFAAMLLGTVAASLPASILRDAFGRRAAFALGAGIGIAGGVAGAFAVAAGLFGLLLVAAFWLGVAQGFGAAYRHEALALPAEWRQTGGYLIFASGAISGLVAPFVLSWSERAASPIPFAGTLMAAGLVQVLVLALAVAPFRHGLERSGQGNAASDWRRWAGPTALAALAWFGMTHAMAHAPAVLIGCGVRPEGIAGFIAWHVVAMYAPALAGPAMSRRVGAPVIVAAGILLVAAGLIVLRTSPSVEAIALALTTTGAGWCLATTGATAMLHATAPTRRQVGLHDAAIVLCALAGALLR